MLKLLAQAEPVVPATDWLDRFPTDEIVVMLVVAVLSSTVLLIAIAWCVTNTIRSIYIASANAKMAEQLAGRGMAADGIERLVRANSRPFWRLPGSPGQGGGWRQPRGTDSPTWGKPG